MKFCWRCCKRNDGWTRLLKLFVKLIKRKQKLHRPSTLRKKTPLAFWTTKFDLKPHWTAIVTCSPNNLLSCFLRSQAKGIQLITLNKSFKTASAFYIGICSVLSSIRLQTDCLRTCKSRINEELKLPSVFQLNFILFSIVWKIRQEIISPVANKKVFKWNGTKLTFNETHIRVRFFYCINFQAPPLNITMRINASLGSTDSIAFRFCPNQSDFEWWNFHLRNDSLQI